jgi:hypothetical protein
MEHAEVATIRGCTTLLAQLVMQSSIYKMSKDSDELDGASSTTILKNIAKIAEKNLIDIDGINQGVFVARSKKLVGINNLGLIPLWMVPYIFRLGSKPSDNENIQNIQEVYEWLKLASNKVTDHIIETPFFKPQGETECLDLNFMMESTEPPVASSTRKSRVT